jgi:hypothetical protein
MSDFEGKVFFVDDEETYRGMVGRQADLANLDYELFEDAPSAIARLEGLDEIALAIFSDGLYGGWRDVVAAAKAARVPAVVLSADDIQQVVEEAGAVFLNKHDAPFGFIEKTLEAIQQDAS